MAQPDLSVAKVAARGGVQDDMNFKTEMQGAKPGEVRGFENEDGTKAYVLRTDGKTSAKQFANYVFNKQEGMNIDPDEVRQRAVELCKHNGIEVDPDGAMEADQEIVCQLKFFARFVKNEMGGEMPATAGGGSGMSVDARKALGYVAPQGGGLGGLDLP